MRPLLIAALVASMCLAPREIRANERVRRASVTLWYRHTALSLPGASGDYHGAGASFLPLHALRAGRWLRWEIGAEAGVRAGPNAHQDVLVTSLMRVGWHRTFGHVTPWVVATGGAGLAAAERLRRTDAQWLWSVGAELGADLRVGGPFGFTAAVGFGRTVEGAVHHDGFWLRAGVAIFP